MAMGMQGMQMPGSGPQIQPGMTLPPGFNMGQVPQMPMGNMGIPQQGAADLSPGPERHVTFHPTELAFYQNLYSMVQSDGVTGEVEVSQF